MKVISSWSLWRLQDRIICYLQREMFVRKVSDLMFFLYTIRMMMNIYLVCVEGLKNTINHLLKKIAFP